MVEPRVVGSKLGVSHIWMGDPLDRNVSGCRLTLNCKKPIGISGGTPRQGFQARSKLGRPIMEKSPQEEAALRKFLHQDVVGR